MPKKSNYVLRIDVAMKSPPPQQLARLCVFPSLLSLTMAGIVVCSPEPFVLCVGPSHVSRCEKQETFYKHHARFSLNMSTGTPSGVPKKPPCVAYGSTHTSHC